MISIRPKMTQIPLLTAILFIVSVGVQSHPLSSFSGQLDEVTSLPGVDFALPFRHYSGYLSTSSGSQLHYWFFESQSATASQDPIALWLTGGPGCSSLGAALSEQGPLQMAWNGSLRLNPYAWNRKANLIFLESPAGVGFSYRQDGNYTTDDGRTTSDNLDAVVSFFRKFAHYANNRFYLIGESYAGVYIPLLAEALIKHKTLTNFTGIAIGNGLLSMKLNTETHLPYIDWHGVTHHSLWSGSMNPYSILQNCHLNLVHRLKRFYILGSEMSDDFLTSDLPPCFTFDNDANWLNDPKVQKALHIRPGLDPWVVCVSPFPYIRGENEQSERVKFIVNSGIKTLIYNGDLDSMCNFMGGKSFTEKLGFGVVNKFSPWKTKSGIVAGFMETFEKNLYFTTVRGAGHMVPTDQPEIAFEMFSRFLEN